MKGAKNLLKIGALATLILAVIASGTAFAQDYHYSGNYKSHWDGSTPWTDQTISSSVGTVASRDTISWDNTMTNYGTSPVTVYVGAATVIDSQHTSQGLYSNEYSVYVPVTGSNNPTTDNHHATVGITGSHQVIASHTYYNGLSYQTVNAGNNMGYY
jgi:hypothetical protein